MARFKDTLFGLLAGAAAVNLPVLTYIGTNNSAADLTTYTFTDEPIGNEAGDRLVVVVIQGEASSARTISSVSIGGNAAAVNATTNISAGLSRNVFAQLTVPSGSTATIVVTFSGAMLNCKISVLTITGLTSTTPTNTQVGSNGTGASIAISSSLTNTAGGVAIAAYSGLGASGNTAWTWTGNTEVTDTVLETNSLAVAIKSGLTGAAEAITASASGSTSARIAAVSWR